MAAKDVSSSQYKDDSLLGPPVTDADLEEVIKNALEIDPYNEDKAELKALKSKPTCFVVVGKPGAGKTALAHLLAQEWKCQHINATEVIRTEMERQTENGKKAQDILMKGGAIPEDMAMKMVEDKIKSDEVKHHGYILDDLPNLSEEYLSIKDQLALIKNMALQPDFIIHVKIPDADIESRRIGQRIDQVTGIIYTKEVYDPEKPPPKEKEAKGDEEEEEEEIEEADEEEEEDANADKLAPEVIQRLVKRPEDLPDYVHKNISDYRSKTMRMIEDYMIDHDQQYLIELDANKQLSVLFQELMMRLQCFILRRAYVVQRLLEPAEEDQELPEDMETEDLMRAMAPKRMIAPRYRWRRSKWLRYCPVALAEGNMLMGRPDLTVSFMDKMYVLSSEEALDKFTKNPRRYLVDPQPRPPCKYIVTGPPQSGKTTLCHNLAAKYGAKVLDVKSKMAPRIEAERQKLMASARAEALDAALTAVKQKVREQYESEQTAKRIEQENRHTDEDDEDKDDATELEPEKKPPEDTDVDIHDDEESDQKPVVTQSADLGLTVEDSDRVETSKSAAEGLRDRLSPGHKEVLGVEETVASELSPEESVNENHPEVVEIVQKAVKQVESLEIKLTAEQWLEIMEESVKECEAEMREKNPTGPINGNWILDNFPQTKEQWTMLFEKGPEKGIMPDDILVLRDDSDQGSLLIKRWYQSNWEVIKSDVQKRKDEAKRRKQDEERGRKELEKHVTDKDDTELRRLEARQTEIMKRLEQGKTLEEVDKEMESWVWQEDVDEARSGSRLTKPQGGASPGAGSLAASPTGSKEKLSSRPQTPTAVQSPKGSKELLTRPASQPQTSAGSGDEEDLVQEQAADDDDDADDDLPIKDYLKPDEGGEPGDEEDHEGHGDTKEEVDTVPSPDHSPMASAKPSIDAANIGPDLVPNDVPEVDEFKEKRRVFEAEWVNIQNIIQSSFPRELIYLDLYKTEEDDQGPKLVTPTGLDVLQEALESIEKKFLYVGWEQQGNDLDEEDEDNEAAAAEEEAVEDEEPAEGDQVVEEDANRSLKKFLGDTSFYCPVALKEKDVLHPGNPEIAAKYREKTYYLSSTEARDKFLEKPHDFLPTDGPLKAPPLRILILGAKGAGKSLHARHLAMKLNLFHIQFRERLQELIIKKTKKKVGPEYEEEEDEEEEPEDDIDEDEDTVAKDGPAIVAPSAINQSKLNKSKTSSEDDDESEEVHLLEEEESIVAYLKDDDPLPTEFLEKLVQPWWHQEPFKSQGFVLEGFPRNVEELEFMAEHGLYPDGTIILTAEDSDIINRLLPPKMAKWKEKMNKKLARRQKKKEKAKKKRDKTLEKRKAELVKEFEERREQEKLEKMANKEDDEEEDEDEEGGDDDGEEEEEENIMEQIEEQLADEFPEEEEEEEEEDEPEDEAKDRLTNGINEIYDKDTNSMSAVQEKMDELLIPKFEVESSKKPHIIRSLLKKKLKKTIEFRHSIFERVYPISENLANRMVAYGYKQPSSFGRWCPVKLYDGDCIQPMQGPGFTTFPCIYRSFVYFLSSKSAQERFMHSPMMYLQQVPPKPVVPIRLAVAGPPKAGKSSLAKEFVDEYGVVRLSIGESIRMVLANQPKSALATAIVKHLRLGLTVPDELAVDALKVAMMDMRCQIRGYILDGYPLTNNQVTLVQSVDIIPVRVVELQVDSRELGTRATKDRYAPTRTQPLHDSTQILAVKLSAWNREFPAVRNWYNEQHSNVVAVDGEKSKWWVSHKAKEIVKASILQIQNYLHRISQGKAVSIANLCITPSEFVKRLGPYHHYCPVSLANGELVDCSKTQSLKYAVEYRGYYYKCHGEQQLRDFLNNPSRYVPPDAPNELPAAHLLPIRRTGAEAKAMFPKPIELQGYCPVTFLDGKRRYEAIKEGDAELVVEYRDKLYYFTDDKNLDKFMRMPQKYWNLTLPHKLPPRPVQIQTANLPMLGFMEQTVSLAITKALTACGNFKPKYPFLSPTNSALVYIAYHLKAYNPKSTDYIRGKYKRKLMHFEETCELISYLGNVMTKRYKDPKERPIDFDFKMEKFMALKQVVAHATPDSWTQ